MKDFFIEILLTPEAPQEKVHRLMHYLKGLKTEPEQNQNGILLKKKPLHPETLLFLKDPLCSEFCGIVIGFTQVPQIITIYAVSKGPLSIRPLVRQNPGKEIVVEGESFRFLLDCPLEESPMRLRALLG